MRCCKKTPVSPVKKATAPLASIHIDTTSSFDSDTSSLRSPLTPASSQFSPISPIKNSPVKSPRKQKNNHQSPKEEAIFKLTVISHEWLQQLFLTQCMACFCFVLVKMNELNEFPLNPGVFENCFVQEPSLTLPFLKDQETIHRSSRRCTVRTTTCSCSLATATTTKASASRTTSASGCRRVPSTT